MPNQKIKIDEIPEEVKNISLELTRVGFENYLVGGCVRDLLWNKKPKDWDITTNATPEEIQKIFPDSFYENEFGTVGVKTDSEIPSLKVIEVTPYRIESSYSDARHPDEILWANSVEEDLSRRDFTINAIALKIEDSLNNKQQFIDNFGGARDLQDKVIRTVGNPDERFQEDALRMLRALRFASELDFLIEHETQEAIVRNKDLLSKISRERIRDEFIKIIESENPALGLELAARLGVLKFISDEFEKGIGLEQGRAHAYTVWEHLLRSLNHAAQKNFPLHVRLAALFHDIAKPHTRMRKGEQWTFYGHEVLGAKLTRKILEDLKFPKELVSKVVKLVRWHMFFSDTETITLSAVRRIVLNVGEDLIWDLINTRTADRIGTGRPKETPYRLRKYKAMIEEVLRDPISVKQLLIKGEDVMALTHTKGGPHVGFILEILLSEVLEDPRLNTREYLEKKVQELHNLSSHELEQLGKEARQKNKMEEEKEVSKIKEEYRVD